MGLRFSAVLGVSTAAAVTEQLRSTEQTVRNRERDMGSDGVRWGQMGARRLPIGSVVSGS